MVLWIAIRQELGRAERRRQAWKDAARLLSGESTAHDGSPGFDLTTREGIHLVSRLERGRAGNDSQTRFDFFAEGGVPPELAIGPEGLAARLGKLILGTDIETGDEAFDKAVLLRGSEAGALAVLDRRTRALVSRAVACGTTISAGAVRRYVWSPPQSVEQILEPSRDLASLARALAQRGTQPVPVLLRENVMGDPVPGVRRRCLEVLLGQFPAHEETRVALDAACVDPDPGLRLFASAQKGGGGVEELAAIVADASLANGVRADALKQLLAAQPGARSLAVAERALGDRSPAVRALAIAAIGKARRTTAVPALVSLAAKAADAAEQLALAEAFWRMRDPAAEGALLDLLDRGDLPVRVEAARALARCGGVRAVEPLHRLRGLLSGELGRVAAESILAIQARLRHAEEGQLSVSEPEAQAGQVSLEDPRGAVAVVRTKTGG